MNKKELKQVFLTLAGTILVLLILNFGYVWDNVKYYFEKPAASVQTQVQEKMDPNKLLIPSLNLDLPIVYAEKVSETEFQQDLQNGVVHYPNTANPGEVGNCYIFGHSSDYFWTKGNYKHAFSTLPHIKVGDEIIISNQGGDKFVYKVTETKVVAANDLSVLNQNTGGKKILTLQTSYPVGTALKRFVAIAEPAP